VGAGGRHLAEFNIARLRAPMDAPATREFADFLDPVNRFAEQSPGFVWRLAAEDGRGSSYLPPAYDDPLVITNLTVWTDLDALRAFAYQTVHRYFLQARRKWFAPLAGPTVVLWWVPAGHRPGLDEARARLARLAADGPSAAAFTLQQAYGPDAAPLGAGRPAPHAAR
jgi:alkylation response protein AidB-like acyl-CoA dehydrogenase